MALEPVVALEIGTSKILTLVGESREDNQVMITGVGECSSAGVRKGEIIDFGNAAACVRSALAMAEESSKVAIRQIHLIVSGGHIQSLKNRGMVPVMDRHGEITRDDMEQVVDVAQAVNLSADCVPLHSLCQYFCIDGQEMVINPEGMEGAKLSLDMLVIYGVRNRIRNTVKVVESIPAIEVADVAFGGLCSSMSVLTSEQKRAGVIAIDIGGGTTDYMVYTGEVVAAAGSLSVGGDHISNDISQAFTIPLKRAEVLKKEEGSAVIEHASEMKRVSVPPEVGFSGRSISINALHTVINARMEEILLMVKHRLDGNGVLEHIGAGVVITGGCVHLKNLKMLVEKVFGMPCSIGKPRSVTGIATVTEGPQHAACCGLIQYGFMTQHDESSSMPITAWFKHLFGQK